MLAWIIHRLFCRRIIVASWNEHVMMNRTRIAVGLRLFGETYVISEWIHENGSEGGWVLTEPSLKAQQVMAELSRMFQEDRTGRRN